MVSVGKCHQLAWMKSGDAASILRVINIVYSEIDRLITIESNNRCMSYDQESTCFETTDR